MPAATRRPDPDHPALARTRSVDAYQQAVSLLSNGQAAAARALFESCLKDSRDPFAPLLGLAYACASSGDAPAALLAVSRALEVQPRDLTALMLKADLLQARSDPSALAFYRGALSVGQHRDDLPSALQGLVDRAAEVVAAEQRRLSEQLRHDLARQLPPQAGLSPRFEQSLQWLEGRQPRYWPQPTLYCWPELPPVPFFPREPFPWLPRLEAATPVIRQELMAVIGGGKPFAPYLTSDPSRPVLNHSSMVDNPAWGAYFLWKDGEPVAEHARQCPQTMAVLEQVVPLVRMPGRSPNVLFSLLQPGAHIPPHHGFLNTRLIGHLPLVVPEGCELRVAHEVRPWVEGQAWLFDDTFEHEAWNRSTHWRVVLLFEVWRPELTQQERQEVCALFAAIDQRRGLTPGWGI